MQLVFVYGIQSSVSRKVHLLVYSELFDSSEQFVSSLYSLVVLASFGANNPQY